MAGASGYFLKEVRALDIVEAVRRIAAGQSLLDPAVTAQVLDRLRRSVPVEPRAPGMTHQVGPGRTPNAHGWSHRGIAVLA
jgi:DNA-binding NarL/FixJ family response regulator